MSGFSRTNADASPPKGERHVAEPAAPKLASDEGERRWDVLLDARETAALRALIRGVRRGTVDLGPVLRASTPSAMELPPVADIEIAPITIAPIAEEGVRQ